MIKSTADFIMGVWTAPEVPLLIEYPLDIMEELRALLSDELHRLSRGGGDIAGVLFGVSRESAIRVMSWRAISREVSGEQSPRMSRHDRAEMVRALGMAASDPSMQGYEPLGWFVSHAEGGTGLTPADIDLFENFFPNSWQVTLLMRRGPGGTARAGFFVREPDGSLRSDASYRELFVQPVRRVPGLAGARSPLTPVASSEQASQRSPFAALPENPVVAETPVMAAREERPPLESPTSPPAYLATERSPNPRPEASKPEMGAVKLDLGILPKESVPVGIVEPAPSSYDAPIAPPPATPPTPQKTFEPQPSPSLSMAELPKTLRSAVPSKKRPFEKTPAEKAILSPAPVDETPSFTMQASSFGGARWLWIGLGLLALALVIFLIIQKTASQAAAASFGLRAAAMGDGIEISWDRDSTPVWNGHRASIKIQDGPDTKQISLSSDQLHAGKTTYRRATPDVAIEMTIYDSGGSEIHEFARFIAPAPYAPSSTPAAQSTDTNQIRAERDNLAAQVERLKADVRKEAARADQAEVLVRILENRLRVEAGRNQSQNRK